MQCQCRSTPQAVTSAWYLFSYPVFQPSQLRCFNWGRGLQSLISIGTFHVPDLPPVPETPSCSLSVPPILTSLQTAVPNQVPHTREGPLVLEYNRDSPGSQTHHCSTNLSCGLKLMLFLIPNVSIISIQVTPSKGPLYRFPEPLLVLPLSINQPAIWSICHPKSGATS